MPLDVSETAPVGDEYGLEKTLVERVECNPEHPLCLYDFTIKHVMTDYIAYSVPNLSDLQLDDYDRFYANDYKFRKELKESKNDKMLKLLAQNSPELFDAHFN